MIKIITKTLKSNSNVLEVTDNAITDTSIFEIYPSDTSTVLPQKVSVSGSTLSIIFDGKASANTPVKIMINNVNGLLDAEDIPYTNLSTPFNDVSSAITGALIKGDNNARDINDLSDIVDERVPDNTVLGGVLYHSTTGNTWKKLDASNIDYDEHSTIYSVMGDIDSIETESKNIVGAINELKEYNSPIMIKNVSGNTLESGVFPASIINLDINYIPLFMFLTNYDRTRCTIRLSSGNWNCLVNDVNGNLVPNRYCEITIVYIRNYGNVNLTSITSEEV